MVNFDELVASLEFIHPKEIIEALHNKSGPQGGQIWEIRNEIRPIDLFCYLGARFGKPNGLQNFLRTDDSDNLIHWDWTLKCEYGWISFLGMNFRTELQLIGSFPFKEEDKEHLLESIKRDFSAHGKQMSHIRKDHLEHWIEFVNPYRRIRGAIDRLLSDLGELNLRPDASNLGDSGFLADQVKGDFEENLAQYSKALGLCFGIRSMLPVMVESFVNLMLFMFMRSDLRNDPRLRDNAIRQQIDIRIKTLHITCIGFKEPINYSSEICGKYHSLVNERNDLLHGNVSIDKLKFNEVYFDRRIPVFKEYRNAWDRSIGVEIGAVGLDMLHAEVEVAEGMIEYLISCVDDRLQANLRRIMETRDLGWNEKNNRLGILFPGTLVDMRAVFEDKKTDTPTEDIKEQAPE